MSVVVGYIDEGNIYVGADSQLTAGSFISTTDHKKIFKKKTICGKEMVIGCVGSTRQKTIVESNFVLPKMPFGYSTREYLVRIFIPRMIDVFKQNGMGIEGEWEINSMVLAFRKSLWHIERNCNLVEYADWVCIGSGSEYAYGALEALRDSKIITTDRIKKAIECAIKYDCYVGGKIEILSIPRSK